MEIRHAIAKIKKKTRIVVVETYQGVIDEELTDAMMEGLAHDLWIDARAALKEEEDVKQMIYPDVTDDRIFGALSRLNIQDFMDQDKVARIQKTISQTHGTIVVYGVGASLIPIQYDLLVYADMARWEIQMRMRQHLVDNVGVTNRNTKDWMLLYKQGFFVEWRACDRLKKRLVYKLGVFHR